MRKILVTEDNLMNREILKDILCDDYEVLEAENGQEALAILNEQYQDIWFYVNSWGGTKIRKRNGS